MVLQVSLELAEPTDEFLVRAPLQLVAFQLRFSASSKQLEIATGLALQQQMPGGAAAWRLDTLSPALKMPLLGGAPGLAVPELQPAGWRLVEDHGAISIAVLPDSVGVESTTYSGWPTFSYVLSQVVRGISDLLTPQAETRLGLRYINRITHPDVHKPEDWKHWIHRDLIAVIEHPIGHGVAAAQQQLDVHGDSGIRASVNHGFFKDINSGRQTYLLDIDTYREGVRAFDPINITLGLANLHRFVLQLFQNSITSDLYKYLKGGEA